MTIIYPSSNLFRSIIQLIFFLCRPLYFCAYLIL
nr:MAG TPA: hypothetical protein [Caudoviricetes sp.]